MAVPNSPNKVRELGRFYENEALSGSRNLAGGFDESEQQLIENALGRRLNEVEKRRTAGQSSPPAIPPRPKRSVGKRADTAVTPSAEDDEAEGDSETPLSNEEESESLTPRGLNVWELKQQSQQAHQKTKALRVQHRKCARDIRALNNKDAELEQKNNNLIAAGSAGKAERAELGRRIDDSRGQLEQANLREDSLRKEIEESRQMERNLRIQLAEAELQAVQDRIDSAVREHGLQQQLHRAEREREEAVAQGQRGLVSGQYSHRDSGFQTPETRQVVGGRCGDYVTFKQAQQRDNAWDMSSASGSVGSGECSPRTCPAVEEEGEKGAQGGERAGLYRSRSNKTAVGILAIATT